MKRILVTACAVAAVALSTGSGAAAQDASATPALSLVHGIPGVTVDVVSYGTESDIGMLDQLAARGGGVHHHADEAKQIDEALFQIEEELLSGVIIVNQ